VNPANPEEGKTGNIIIIMNEVYPNPDEIGNHMNVAQKWVAWEDSFIYLWIMMRL
jgi:hypothetical protein